MINKILQKIKRGWVLTYEKGLMIKSKVNMEKLGYWIVIVLLFVTCLWQVNKVNKLTTGIFLLSENMDMRSVAQEEINKQVFYAFSSLTCQMFPKAKNVKLEFIPKKGTTKLGVAILENCSPKNMFGSVDVEMNELPDMRGPSIAL